MARIKGKHVDIHLRVTTDEYVEITDAAEIDVRTTNNFIKKCALTEARRINRTHPKVKQVISGVPKDKIFVG